MSLLQQVIAAFYERRMGGVVVTCGDKLMVAIEFDGPYGQGGIDGEMVYADKNPACQAVWQGRGCTPRDLGANFLAGETIEFISADNENDFKILLKQCQRKMISRGLIDIKSGLKLHEGQITP
mmetsp:Transcript_61495/g.150519  ORF Transcript_61495/g.150519 Transcript_61495/m.150519 type:complete len:123 (-) Transcript_61495:664-1032(-)|eukprot:CAMPEP_0113465176 /NCGR_PEP_ID=MMETSP0014_2-20120614/13599_1 /TAXON_ID=2857 /ORGANISM="Nitzschia sp." /LENGTH=122 /DNA_ID=CAMNT_0000357315 /DNA_START=99 /DNA_END=467 /DNA_ORIENTATION=+ /assembly_acc=CAM_ASM_000159